MTNPFTYQTFSLNIDASLTTTNNHSLYVDVKVTRNNGKLKEITFETYPREIERQIKDYNELLEAARVVAELRYNAGFEIDIENHSSLLNIVS